MTQEVRYTWQDPALADFRNCVYLIWKHLNLPDPTPIQYDVADFLQSGPNRRIIEGFRGMGKTWLTVGYVLWRLYWNPEANYLVISASKQHADNFSIFCKRLLTEIEWLAPLRPKEGQRDSAVAFDVGPAPAAHAPSVKSIGITGQMTGSRADEVIADDIEVPKNSATQIMRDKLAEQIKEIDAILKPGGRATLLGTPQTEQSVYNVLEQRGYVVRIWPARVPDARLRNTYGTRLSPYVAELKSKPGEPTEPTRFDSIDLAEREASYGRSGFALQFMLDTSLSDANRYPLKVSDLIVMDLNPHMGPERPIWASSPDLVWNDLPCVALSGDRYHRPMRVQGDYIPYKGVVMAVDPSGRGKDELAASVVANINGNLFLLDNIGLTEGYADRNLIRLAETAKQFKVNHIVVEENYGDGMFSKLLTPWVRKIYPCPIEEIKHSKQKELRIIDTLEPVLNQHRLIVDRSLIDKDFNSRTDLPDEQRLRYQLFYQLTRVTKDKNSLLHDDRLDSLAMAVAYWANTMGVDQERQEASRRAAILDEEIRKFLQDAEVTSGYRQKERSWLQTNRAFQGP